MIPLKLTLSGFLSYRTAVTIDFSAFDLACISGANGAGKSSLLDAITWALFGQARRRDEMLINTGCDVAEVELLFQYETAIYRVRRIHQRGKSTVLEFDLLVEKTLPVDGKVAPPPDSALWKSLRAGSLRETQAAIESILRLDYETFVNASFFLQGRADQFTRQRPADRKRILANILGLERWEVYRREAVERRRQMEAERNDINRRLDEIDLELAEEAQRKERLAVLRNELDALALERAAQERALKDLQAAAAVVVEKQKLIETLTRQLDAAEQRWRETEAVIASRLSEKAALTALLSREAEIRAAYQAWQETCDELRRWDETAGHFYEYEKRRHAPLAEIEAERIRLEEEKERLVRRQAMINESDREAEQLRSELKTARQSLAQLEAQLAQRVNLEAEMQQLRQQQADARAENPLLRMQMLELKERIDRLQTIEEAACPLCGKPLSPEERQRLIDELSGRGRQMGDRYRHNQKVLQEAGQRLAELEAEIAHLRSTEAEVRRQTREIDRLSDRLTQIERERSLWEKEDVPRLQELNATLEGESFAEDARRTLASIDAELKAIGYDVAAHDALRRAETAGRQAEKDLVDLEKAQAALLPLERQIVDLQKVAAVTKDEMSELQRELALLQKELVASSDGQSVMLTFQQVEQERLAAQERENRLRLALGAAEQTVAVLETLKARRKTLQRRSEELTRLLSFYKRIETAFSKDGVPALLIEEALPQVEGRANDILSRLSDGELTVRFITQRDYKSRGRNDQKETLDIAVRDGIDWRDYEACSGGEAFRVDFAIRLALAEFLTQRSGARLQTLFIDEGFGSQDAYGRQRLIEAIEHVRADFAKILVITHLDELKSYFPTRIEVEKTPDGSQVRLE